MDSIITRCKPDEDKIQQIMKEVSPGLEKWLGEFQKIVDPYLAEDPSTTSEAINIIFLSIISYVVGQPTSKNTCVILANMALLQEHKLGGTIFNTKEDIDKHISKEKDKIRPDYVG